VVGGVRFQGDPSDARHCPSRVAALCHAMQGDDKSAPRRPGRLRGIVDATASPDVGDPSGSGVDGADAAAPTGRRTRFAPTVPSERRSRNSRAVVEDTAEPKLSTHVQHLVKQAHLDGKTVRPREPVRGLERRPRRGELDLSKPESTTRAADSNAALGSGGAGGTSLRAMDVDAATMESVQPDATRDSTRTTAVFSAGKPKDTKRETRKDSKEALKDVVAAKGERNVSSVSETFRNPLTASPMNFDSAVRDDEDARDVHEDWTDKSQYYPTVLRPCPDESGDEYGEEIGLDGSRVKKSAFASRKQTWSSAAPASSKVGERLRNTEAHGEYLVVQLPFRLSLAANVQTPFGTDGGDDDRAGGDRTRPGADSEYSGNDVSSAASLSELQEGRLGDLEIRADGSVRLVIGNAAYDVLEGTRFAHVEQLACVDTGGGSDAKCAFLGRVPGRLVCVPDVAALLAER